MTKVDQFESVFKAAAKTPYHHARPDVRTVLVLTDLDETGAEAFAGRVRAFLAPARGTPAGPEPAPAFRLVHGTGTRRVDDLLALVREAAPDVIATYRSLYSDAWRWSYTLGLYIDILAQETSVPVLLLPHPRQEAEAPESFPHGPPHWSGAGPDRVMAMTDELAGDHHLIHWAVRLACPEGRLALVHVEDGRVFARYLDAISKIPEIDTELARERLGQQLLKEPADFIESCRTALAEARPDLAVEKVVTMGHRLYEYRRLIEEGQAELLVLNTKAADQLAMKGIAYPLVVELRHVPILML